MLFTGREVRMGKNCARGLEYGPRPKFIIFFVFLLFKVGKQIYRRHLVQSFFLRLVKIHFHYVRSHQSTFS